MTLHANYMLPISLFLCVLGFVAFTINGKTQRDFNLQHIGVESLVERHTFALEGSAVPELQPLGDTFSFNDHVYAIKQPGQFVLGAFVYSVIHALGLSYQMNYVLVASLVTLFTSGVLCAGIGVALYYVARHLGSSPTERFFIGLAGTIATILLPYSGVAHHDVQATAFVCIGWSLIVVARSKVKYLVAGLLVGSALFISMLPIVVCLGVGLYVVSQRRIKDIGMFGVGGLIGMAPVFLYNWLLYGNLLAFPNSISGTTDTTPFISLTNTVEKVQFYLLSPTHSLFAFMPVLLFGLLGVFFFGRKYRREALFILALFFGHLAYVSSIETVGHAQYGPRYLLPILPFLAVGLTGLKNTHPFMQRIASVLGLISFCITLVGALGGVMYQTIWIHPFWQYVEQLTAGALSPNPLRLLGVIFLSLSISVGYLALRASSKNV